MSFDKAKIMRTAEKNLAQGKIQAAIRDYCQIVENDPKDFNAMNLLGDLYVRVDSENEAVKCFTGIAEQYSTQGFAHKAIAMYKKIARLKPQLVEISAKLAPLYQQQGLMAEARLHYLTVADSYKNNGLKLESLEILGKIADLDPNNTDIRLKLAEGYLQEDQINKATDAFIEAASRLLAKGQSEKSLAIFNQVLQLRPLDTAALNGATSANIALGLPDEAVTLLEQALETQPENSEVMSLLIHAYLETGNPAGAENTARKLVVREPASHKRFLDIAASFLKINDTEGATRAITACSEQLIGKGQDKDLEHWTNEVLKHNPENIEALKLLVRLHGWQRDEEKLLSALERLFESAQLNGDKLEEHNALVQLVPLKPADEELQVRLAQLVEELGITPPETQSAWVETEVPSFESFEQMTNENSTGQISPEALANFHEMALGFGENNGAATENIAWAEESIAFDTANPMENHGFAITSANPAETFGENGNVEADNPRRAAHLRQELESVDFYITQGYQELASETLSMLEKQFGKNADIEERRKQLEPSKTFAFFSETTFDFAGIANSENNNPAVAEELAFQDAPPPVPNGNGIQYQNAIAVELKAPERFTTNDGIESGLAELFDEHRDSVELEDAEASQGSDYETHYNLGLAYKEMGLMEDAVEEFQRAIKLLNGHTDSSLYLQCCNLLGHCFMEQKLPKPAIIWFKKGLNAPAQGEEEYQALRYELALAYEAGGEPSKALELFNEIYAADVSYRNVSERMRELLALNV